MDKSMDVDDIFGNEHSIEVAEGNLPEATAVAEDCLPLVCPTSVPAEKDSSFGDLLSEFQLTDVNRRSSLGAESLLEHDIEDSNFLDAEGENITYYEAQLCLQYADDIFQFKKELEQKYHPLNCVAEQPQVTEYIRCTLVNWMGKVNQELHFSPETAFLAVNITDRFLAATPIAQDCLQLLAICALFIAAKMEETNVPGISVLVALCGSAYKHHHFRRMETLILRKLQFELHAPTVWYFINHISICALQLPLLDRRIITLARFVVETCVCSYDISQFLPSIQASAAWAFSSYFFENFSDTSLQEISLKASEPCTHRLSLGLNFPKDSSAPVTEGEPVIDPVVPTHMMFQQQFGRLLQTSLAFKILHDLVPTEALKDVTTCSTLMSQYMAPFMESCSTHFSRNETLQIKPDNLIKTSEQAITLADNKFSGTLSCYSKGTVGIITARQGTEASDSLAILEIE